MEVRNIGFGIRDEELVLVVRLEDKYDIDERYKVQLYSANGIMDGAISPLNKDIISSDEVLFDGDYFSHEDQVANILITYDGTEELYSDNVYLSTNFIGDFRLNSESAPYDSVKFDFNTILTEDETSLLSLEFKDEDYNPIEYTYELVKDEYNSTKYKTVYSGIILYAERKKVIKEQKVIISCVGTYKDYPIYASDELLLRENLQKTADLSVWRFQSDLTVDADGNSQGYIKLIFRKYFNPRLFKSYKLGIRLTSNTAYDIANLFDIDNPEYTYDSDNIKVDSITFYVKPNALKNFISGTYLITFESDDDTITDIRTIRNIVCYGELANISRKNGTTITVDFSVNQNSDYLRNAVYSLTDSEGNEYFNLFTVDEFEDSYVEYMSFTLLPRIEFYSGTYKLSIIYTDEFENTVNLTREFELDTDMYSNSLEINNITLNINYNAEKDENEGYLEVNFSKPYAEKIASNCYIYCKNRNEDSDEYNFNLFTFFDTSVYTTVPNETNPDLIDSIRFSLVVTDTNRITENHNGIYEVYYVWNDVPDLYYLSYTELYFYGAIKSAIQSSYNAITLKLSDKISFKTLKNSELYIHNADGSVDYTEKFKDITNSNLSYKDDYLYSSVDIMISSTTLNPDYYYIELELMENNVLLTTVAPIENYLTNAHPYIDTVESLISDTHSSYVQVYLTNYVLESNIESVTIELDATGYKQTFGRDSLTFISIQDQPGKIIEIDVRIDDVSVFEPIYNNTYYDFTVTFAETSFFNPITTQAHLWYYGSIEKVEVVNIKTLRLTFKHEILVSDLSTAQLILYHYKTDGSTNNIEYNQYNSITDSNTFTTKSVKSILIKLTERGDVLIGNYRARVIFYYNGTNENLYRDFDVDEHLYGFDLSIASVTPYLTYDDENDTYSGYFKVYFNASYEEHTFNGTKYAIEDASTSTVLPVFNQIMPYSSAVYLRDVDNLIIGLMMPLKDDSVIDTAISGILNMKIYFEEYHTMIDYIAREFSFYIYGGMRSVMPTSGDTLQVKFSSYHNYSFYKSVSFRITNESGLIDYTNCFENTIYNVYGNVFTNNYISYDACYLKLKENKNLYSGTYKLVITYLDYNMILQEMEKTFVLDIHMAYDYGEIASATFFPTYDDGGLKNGYLLVTFTKKQEIGSLRRLLKLDIVDKYNQSDISSLLNQDNRSYIYTEVNGRRFITGVKFYTYNNIDLTEELLKSYDLSLSFDPITFIPTMTKARFKLIFKIGEITDVVWKSRENLNILLNYQASNILLSKLGLTIKSINYHYIFPDYEENFNNFNNLYLQLTSTVVEDIDLMDYEKLSGHAGKKFADAYRKGGYNVSDGRYNNTFDFRVCLKKYITCHSDTRYYFDTNYEFYTVLIEELNSNKDFLRFTKLTRGTAFVTQSNTKYLAVTIEYDDGTKEDVGDCFIQYPVDNEENTATSNCIDLKIKTYCSLHPDFYRVELNYEGTIIGPWEGYVPALMDKPFSDDNDQLCYIVKRTRNNVVKYLVFTSFDEAKAKVNKYDKINETTEAQYLLCKKCVKKNILYAKTKKMVLDRETSPKNYIHTKVMQIMHKYLVKIFGCKQASLIWSYSNEAGGNFECENKMDEYSRIDSEILVGSLSLGDYIPSGDREQKVYLVKVSTNKSTFFKVFINENESSYKEYLRRMTNYQKLFTARMNTCKECMKNILVSQDGTNAKFGAYMNNDILANPEVREDTENKFTSILTKISSGCEYAEAILENVASQDDTCKVSCVNYLHPDSYFEITTVDGIYYNMDAPDDD